LAEAEGRGGVLVHDWTKEGLLRHARYVDLRPEVEAKEVRREG
jgi:hypothetical protein